MTYRSVRGRTPRKQDPAWADATSHTARRVQCSFDRKSTETGRRYKAVRELAPAVFRIRKVGKRQQRKVVFNPGNLSGATDHVYRRRHRRQIDASICLRRLCAPGVCAKVKLRAILPDLDMRGAVWLAHVAGPISSQRAHCCQPPLKGGIINRTAITVLVGGRVILSLE